MVKNKPRHIREIKPMRDRMCAQDLSDEFEYAGDVAFDRFNTLKAFYAAHPDKRRYYTKHCTRQKVPESKKDSMGGVYVKANTKWKCDKLQGHWDPSALSRANYKMLGACFVTPEERKCAKHDHPQLMAKKHGQKVSMRDIPLTTVSHAISKCGQERTGCGWIPATGKCHAKQTIAARKDAAARTIQTQERLRQLRKQMKIAEAIRKKNAAARVIQQYARKAQAARRARLLVRDHWLQKQLAAKQIQNVVRKHQGRANKLPADWPTNLRAPGVDKYLRDYYQMKKSQWPVPNSGRYGGGCSRTQQKSLFTAPQAILHAIARGMRLGQNRGLLAWHSTGSGKTCSAAAVMDAYWKTNKNIVFCTSVEAKQANPPETFRKCINTFLKRGITESQMARRVQFFSFAQLAHYLQLYRGSGPDKNRDTRASLLENAVLIIDEVQNLLKPLPNQVAEHRALYQYLAQRDLPGLNVFILTATPGESPQDVVDLLNLVRDRRHAPITTRDSLDEFRTKTRGIIQHYDTNHDLSRFPRVLVNAPNVCRMSKKQQDVYAKALQDDLAKKASFPSPKYMALSRKYASHTYTRDSSVLSEYSCKIPQIHQKLLEYPDQKHWLYSAFYESRGYGQGVMAVKRTLLEDLGYEELTPSMAKQMVASGTFSRKRRFCVVTTTNVKDRQELTDLLSVYNSPQNVHGAVCHVMLASQKFNEGLDLKAVRHIHLLEPLVTVAMRQQAIGRARRNCSHFQLNDMNDWTVQIHDYFSEPTVAPQRQNSAERGEYQETLARLTAALESIKGVRGVKAQRDQLTEQIKATKQAIKAIQKQQKEIADTQGLFSVDMHVDELARTAYEPTRRLLDVMRESSLDRLVG